MAGLTPQEIALMRIKAGDDQIAAFLALPQIEHAIRTYPLLPLSQWTENHTVVAQGLIRSLAIKIDTERTMDRLRGEILQAKGAGDAPKE